MGISSVCGSRFCTNTELLGNVPCVLVNDGFVGIGEYHQFFRRCGSALLCLEVLTDGFAQHGMTEIFLPVQNMTNRICVPTVRVAEAPVSAIFGEILCRICRWYQHLFFGQLFRNRRHAHTMTGKTEHLSDDFSSRFIHNKGLLISVDTLVAIGDSTAAP